MEIDMAWGVDEVEHVWLFLGLVDHGDGRGLDSDAPLPFEIHGIEELLFRLTGGDGASQLHEAVGQGALAVIDMGDDGEVSDVVGIHIIIVSVLSASGQRVTPTV